MSGFLGYDLTKKSSVSITELFNQYQSVKAFNVFMLRISNLILLYVNSSVTFLPNNMVFTSTRFCCLEFTLEDIPILALLLFNILYVRLSLFTICFHLHF